VSVLVLLLGLGGGFILVGIVVATVLSAKYGSPSAAWIAPVLILPVVLVAGFVLFGFLFTARSTMRCSARPQTTASNAHRNGSTPLVPGVKTIVPVVETMEGETAEEDATEESPTTLPEAATEARPEWVDASPQRIDSGDVFQTSVAVGPFLTRHECTQALPDALQAAVATYIADYRGPKAASRVRLSSDYIRDKIVTEEFTETVDLDPATRIILEPDEAGPMVRLHVLLQFDRAAKSHIDQLWRRSVITGRLWLVGFAAVGVMLLLSVLFAVLKIDRATGGNARGRLALGVVGGMMLLAVTALIGLRMVGFQRLNPATSAVPVRMSSTAEITVDRGIVEPRDLSVPQQASPPVAITSAFGLVALPVGLLMLTGLIALLAFKKTRPIGLVMLTLLVVGVLVMIA